MLGIFYGDEEMSDDPTVLHKGTLYVFGESTIEVDFCDSPYPHPFGRAGQLQIIECMTAKEQLVDDLVHFVALLACGWSLYAFGELVNQYVSWEFIWAQLSGFLF